MMGEIVSIGSSSANRPAITAGLTRRQSDLLRFITLSIEADRGAPSFNEMRDALGLRSKSGIHRILSGLEERGFIRRLPNRARALEVLRFPGRVDAPAIKDFFPDELWAAIEKAAALENQTPMAMITEAVRCWTESVMDEHRHG